MFAKLKRKWNVSRKQFTLIFTTFAVTGTFTAFISKSITSWINVPKYSAEWWMLKIVVLLIGYQIFLLFFGFCFGQFSFFWNYEKKLLSKLRISKKQPHTLAVFASGNGSNALKIIEYFNLHKKQSAKVTMVVCNNPSAGVLNVAKKSGIPILLIERNRFYKEDAYLDEFKKIDFIILAGFLWKIPEQLIKAFPQKIINIHPALLPKYGGKGMYGSNVHEAVVNNKEQTSGITIHYVDEHYDNGDIIFQKSCEVNENDTAASLAKKVLSLEHEYYPQVIESIIKAKSTLKKNR